MTLGVAEEVQEPSERQNALCYYMPHHAIIREDRATTKVRVVFDASSHSRKGMSLNENLEAGPNLNEDMLSLLINFRKEKVALVGDVEKAFLQISIHEEDRDAMRFLWWKHDAEGKLLKEVQTWRMTRVTFGTTPSTFLLAATIKHHLKQVEDRFPDTTRTLQKAIYVDDVILGAATLNDAVKLYKEAKQVFREAAMNLRKWTSNEERLNKIIDENERDDSHIEIRSRGFTMLLGLIWKHSKDVISFPVEKWESITDTTYLTKRSVLQATAKIFDPLGLLSPFTVRAKIGLQRLWKTKVTWDDQLPKEEFDKWTNLMSEAQDLRVLEIIRCYASKDQPVKAYELHVFADASPTAYGAAAYLIVVYRDGSNESRLVTAKSRVAPIKELTLARLELMAAVVASRLCDYIKGHFNERIQEIHCWTDSMIVLHWIQGTSKRDSFVTNRIAEIRKNTLQASWSFVQSEDNPADLLTRGISAKVLINSKLWWNGPEWITSLEKNTVSMIRTNADVEEQHETQCHQCTGREQNEPILEIERYSSYGRLVRVTAWVFRFIDNTRRENHKGPLTGKEVTNAEKYWIRQTQVPLRQTTGEDYSSAKSFEINGHEVYLDDDGIIRQKGRLQCSQEHSRNVIVIPKDGHFSELLIHHVHQMVLHGGVQATLAQIRTKFWILQGRQAVKRVLNRCIVCKRHNSRPTTQNMPPLPADRVNEAEPFKVTGVDFTGTLYAKDKNEIVKQYVLIFTCAVTRGVHLEVTNNLSSSSFLQAFRRFTARRGMPAVVYSDNAKTFIKDEREINRMLKTIEHEVVKDYCSGYQIQWKTIAECAPWWGGFYERLIRSLKTSMRKIISKRTASVEELRTIVAEVEGALNNRPLTYVYGEPNEPMPLTPADIIGGRRQLQDVQTRLYNFDVEDVWRSRCKLVRAWWKRWHREYIKEIGATVKAKTRQAKPLSQGDMVLIEDKGPRTFWKMCRIEKLYPGRDGITRACLLRTGNKELLRRSVNHIYPLEGCFK